MEEWYDFLVHENVVVECVPKGFSKASGIRFVCEKLGIEHKNTYAFGDSVNDVEMLKYVANGIAMGNGTEEAKQAADYVTDDIHENGIYNACRHFFAYLIATVQSWGIPHISCKVTSFMQA